MGSPSASVLANLFIGLYEKKKKWLSSNYHGVSPSYYTPYVNNTFSVFNSNDKAKRSFSYLNSRDTNIKFTMETEVNKVIPLFGCPY